MQTTPLNLLKALDLYTSKDSDRYNICDRFRVKKHDGFISLASADGHCLLYITLYKDDFAYNFFLNLLGEKDEISYGNLSLCIKSTTLQIKELKIKDDNFVAKAMLTVNPDRFPEAERVIPMNIQTQEFIDHNHQPRIQVKFLERLLKTVNLCSDSSTPSFNAGYLFTQGEKNLMVYSLRDSVKVIIAPVNQ